MYIQTTGNVQLNMYIYIVAVEKHTLSIIHYCFSCVYIILIYTYIEIDIFIPVTQMTRLFWLEKTIFTDSLPQGGLPRVTEDGGYLKMTRIHGIYPSQQETNRV